jgi:hypothetical protein
MLQIREGVDELSTSLGQYCGYIIPNTIITKDRYLWLKFKSNEHLVERGFKAVYEFIPQPSSGN